MKKCTNCGIELSERRALICDLCEMCAHDLALEADGDMGGQD